MKSSLSSIIAEAQSKLSGYVMLLAYNYYNICVKAEAVSLLSLTIDDQGTEYDIENVADVANLDEYRFAIYPKTEAMLFNIAKAIKKSHPEFIIDEDTTAENNDIPHYKPTRYLICTMPEVDSDRRDKYNDLANAMYDQTKLKVEAIDGVALVKLNREAIKSTAEEMEEANTDYKDVYDQIKELMDKSRDDKLKEIEEGYQRYLTKQSEMAQKQSDKEMSSGSGAGFNMDINSNE